MEINQNSVDNTESKAVSEVEKELLQELASLSGENALDRILELENPRQLVQQVPQTDFFWLIKKLGEEDCSPLLRMASDDQKQHLLDLEFWEKDRFDLEKASAWIERLFLADPKGFIRWLSSKGEALAFYYVFKSVQVEIRDGEEEQEIEEGFFTVDGTFYVKIFDEAHRETIEKMLRTMAGVSLDQYQTLLQNLGGIISAELEEDMYRLRNVRLAEHGFLPREEAMVVYAHLSPDALAMAEVPAEPGKLANLEELHSFMPLSPFYHSRGQNMLSKAFSRINDNLQMDRMRLEFAGLCNQIMSADGIQANDLDTLIGACRKAAGHLNLALEKLCGKDILMAEEVLLNHALVSVFRVGFGQVLELKWETERWLKNSWFFRQGLNFSFWGDDWEGLLAGITENKPRLYGDFEEGEPYKAFERISEVDDCRRLVHRLKALDTLLERLTEHYTLDREGVQTFTYTFRHMLFTLWARKKLNLTPCFSSVSIDQARALFRHLRAGAKTPPFRMPGLEETFVHDFTTYVPEIEPEFAKSLRLDLSLIWQQFLKEYEWVAGDDMEGRFLDFILID